MKLLQIDAEGRVVAEWQTPSQAANELDLDASHISKCTRGERKTHGGFSWEWAEGDVEGAILEEGSKTFDYRKDGATLSAKTERPITNLEEAIEFFEVDTDKWEVERFIVNAWDVSMKDKITGSSFKRTNYQVKVFLKVKEKSIDEILVDVNKSLEGYAPKSINITTGRGVITAEFADFHIGADIKNLVRTPDFDIKILADYLYSSAELINSYRAEHVIVNFHGDFFESISGLNHDDSWKSLGSGMYGANVIILANELIGAALLENINNLREINIVSGNHDRISASNKVDTRGEGARLLAYILQKDYPGIKINYNPLILVRNIDGINHILTHGHTSISKKDLSKIVFDYGDSKLFNLWTEGHLHSRTSKKVLKKKVAEYNEIEYVSLDEQKYRKIVLPPMFTGNFFSESIGFGGYAGFLVTFNNGKGIPNVHDYTV